MKSYLCSWYMSTHMQVRVENDKVRTFNLYNKDQPCILSAHVHHSCLSFLPCVRVLSTFTILHTLTHSHMLIGKYINGRANHIKASYF